jgi:anti-sigma factor RsiW
MRVLARYRRRRGDELACRQAVELMTAYLDDALSAPEAARLEHHLAGCPHCTEYLHQLRVTIGAVHAAATEPLSAATTQSLAELYQSWLRDGA